MPKEVVVCCSLGKALAIQSGAIFGTKSRLEQIQGTELFGGASPAAPALMATLIAGKDLFAHKKRILDSHIGLLDTQVKKWGSISRVPDHPCYSYADPALTKHLEANKIIVTDFSYPASDGPHTSRIVLSASHLTADIVLLAKALNGYFSP
jgi:hypothetical protein